MRMTKNNMKLK